jgi:UDP-sugar transporter A1/2/3
VLCAAVGALGGVLVALSIKYTDSILKTIATTG